MDRKKIIEKLYMALAAEPFEYEGALEIQDQAETIDPTPNPTVSDYSKVICTGTIQNPDGTTTPYTITEGDIIEATFCGEAASCSLEQRKAIMAVAFNRTKRRPRTIKRGEFTFDGFVAELIDPKQYSCWDNVKFNNCDNLRAGVLANKAKCAATTVLPSLDYESLLQSLINLGFNGSRDKGSANYDPAIDPTNVFNYSTPKVLAKKTDWNPCLNGINIPVGSKIEIASEEWEIIIHNGKPTKNCFHFTGMRCAIISDGCHAFLSNNSDKYRMEPTKKIVKCPNLQPPLEPGKRRRICLTATPQEGVTQQ
jgi:hypothetical protein